MVLLFYVDECLMFNHNKYKIDEVYAPFFKAYFKIEDDVELNNYLGIELYLRPDVSIHLRQPYFTHVILNMIPGMCKSSPNPTPAVKYPLAKKCGTSRKKKYFN